MKEKNVLTEIDLPFPKIGKKEEAGKPKKTKVREVFDVGQDDAGHNLVLMVATDRVSVNDVVLLSGIPGKGEVLTRISAYWFKEMRPFVPNAFVTDNFEEFPLSIKKELEPFRDHIKNRSTLMYKARPFPVECIVRNKLLGSGWGSYSKEGPRKGTLHGIPLPAGMKKGDRLPAPLFTPSTKAEEGHDENINFEKMQRIISLTYPDSSSIIAQIIASYSLSLYCFAQSRACLKGIEIDDTKFEFGFSDKALIVQIDESLTPDSSRYNPDYSKQPLRDWLDKAGWDKETPIELPSWVIEKTSSDYRKVCEMITGYRV